MKSLYDRTFQYTPSSETNLKKTFARLRRLQQEARTQADGDTRQDVLPVSREKMRPEA